MADKVTPKEEREEELNDLKDELQKAKGNAEKRRVNRQMIAPTPDGIQANPLSNEEIENDENIISENIQDLEKKIEVAEDHAFSVAEEKSNVSRTFKRQNESVESEQAKIESEVAETEEEINQFIFPPSSPTSATETEDYFQPSDFNGLEADGKAESFNSETDVSDSSSPTPPSPESGIEP